jgi:hypothetical protein
VTLTKWDAELIYGLDEAVDGDMEGDYLPLEGGTLTGELTVDANLILEGAITEGDCVLKEYREGDIRRYTAVTTLGDTPTPITIPEKQYILTPSQGTMQHLNMKCNTRLLLKSNQIPQSQSDQDYFFDDGQSMTIRIEVHDLDKPLEDRYRYAYRLAWPDFIWWVNTEDGLAPDVNKTGAITVNLWKAKGVLYGQLAGDYVNPEIEYHPNAFDMSKLKWDPNHYNSNQWRKPSDYSNDNEAEGPAECRIFGPDPVLKDSDVDWPQFVHDPYPSGNQEHGIDVRGGVTFTRTSRDGMHHFLGQTGSADNPSELRTFTNSIPSDTRDQHKFYYDEYQRHDMKPGGGSVRPDTPGYVYPSLTAIPHQFYCGARNSINIGYPQASNLQCKYLYHMDKMYTEAPKLLGTAVDMKLRVEKGSGVDFNPDGTRMFQSVSNYLDPSLKDKYENVIGAHHLAEPWNVGRTDFLIKEELNDIIYCDEKYSEVRALHPNMRVCCLTFRPDGMGFYFAYVVYEDSSENLQYYFVQQDLEVPWELSSAKDDYKYSKLFTHEKYEDRKPLNPTLPGNAMVAAKKVWHINCITVSDNGKYLHVAFPHAAWVNGDVVSDKPRQFEMTTPWDMSTGELSWIGIGVTTETLPVERGDGRGKSAPTETNGGFAGHYLEALTHSIHWNDTGTRCYVSMVPETNLTLSLAPAPTHMQKDGPSMLNTDHYFNQKVWELDPDA